MLNFQQRINRYKQTNYFLINGVYLDLFVPKLSGWYQDTLVISDILEYASLLKLNKDNYEILNIRFIGGTVDANTKSIFTSNLDVVNESLAHKLSKSSIWEDANKTKPHRPRHFAVILLDPDKPVPYNEPKRKRYRSKPIPELPDGIGSV